MLTREEKKAIQQAERTVRPFACGTQYLDWSARNCARCAKGYRTGPARTAEDWSCPIEYGIDFAHVDDGMVSQEIADRMGHTKAHEGGEHPIVWPCPERQ